MWCGVGAPSSASASRRAPLATTMSSRPRAGMRLPAGHSPVDASIPKEEADRLKAKEDEVLLHPNCCSAPYDHVKEFEKFLNDVAEGEAKLKAREDAERQRDWQETQDYLKKQKDARTPKPAAAAASPTGTTIRFSSAPSCLPGGGSFRSDPRLLAMLGPAPQPPSAAGAAASPPLGGLAARAASPPPAQHNKPPARSPLSPERVRVVNGAAAGGGEARPSPAGFKSPPRGLMPNPAVVAPTAATKKIDFSAKIYPQKQVVLLQALARRWLVLNARRKKGALQFPVGTTTN